MSLRKFLLLLPVIVLLSLLSGPCSFAQQSGRIAGTVVDPSGVPQMGATVSFTPDLAGGSPDIHAFSDARGRFISAPLVAGSYSVTITLAGFLPALERHVDVNQLHTTLLRVQLGTALASLERSAAPPPQRVTDSDDWKWVLRGATATRPVLRWSDDTSVADDDDAESSTVSRQPRAELAVSAGTDQPGVVTNFADAPTTGFAYDMNLGAAGHLVMAGAFSYLNEVPAGGFDTLWVQGDPQSGQTVTGVVLRQSELGPAGPAFHGMRLSRQSRLLLTDKLSLGYGGEIVLADLNGFTSSVRPNLDLNMQVAPSWLASVILATEPWPSDSDASDARLQQALASLNAFPNLLERNNRPVLAGGWHEEAAIKHKVGKSGDFVAAAFHDQAVDSPVFGEGSLSGPNILPDYFSNGFAYDAGSSSSYGARVVYRQKLGADADVAFMYTFAGVLAPVDTTTTTTDLSGLLATRYRHSVGAHVSAKVPRLGTKVTTGYVWISGAAVGPLDPYGQAIYGFDPYFSIGIRQPLPAFFPGHMMLVADINNLLAQGYVPITTKDGRVLLVPTYRTFQGGVSFHF